MSEEAHPNVNAVGVTTDILSSIEKYLRGKGLDFKKEIFGDNVIKKRLTDFVVDVSTRIDEIVEEQEGTTIFDVQPGHYREGTKHIDRKGQIFKVVKK